MALPGIIPYCGLTEAGRAVNLIAEKIQLLFVVIPAWPESLLGSWAFQKDSRQAGMTNYEMMQDCNGRGFDD